MSEQVVVQPTGVEAPTAAAAMPEGGHEKFYDAATGAYNWEGHAKQVEWNLSQAKSAAPAPAPTGAPTNDGGVQDLVTKAGLTMEGLTAELRSNGELSPASRQAIIDQGWPAAALDDYTTMVVERMTATTEKALEAAGGEEAWKALTDWARQNLEADEINWFNEQLQSAHWPKAMDLLKARAQAANAMDGEGKMVMEGNSSNFSGAAVPFRSEREMMDAMQDPKYQKDSAYRADVARRMQASDTSLVIRDIKKGR